MRHDKLREQGRQKDNAFRVGQVDENRALEQFSTRLRLCQGIEIERSRRAPLLNTQPDKISRPGPLQHLDGQHRAGKQRSQADTNKDDMDRQPGL